MIQPPKNTKYRKYQRNYLGSTPAKKATTVCFGAYGLQCNQSTMVSLTQLETCRRMLRRTIKRQAPVWIRAFPWKPLYKQDQGHRMGKGKGDRYAWVCPVKPGQILLEVGGQMDEAIVRNVFSSIASHPGIPMKLVHANPALVAGPSRK